MAVVTYGHRAKETSTTTGTGTVTLAGATTGHQTLVAAAGDGAYVPYTIVGTSGAAEGEWETGYGTVTDAASDTLSRTVVSDSSNSGSLVNFSAGTKEVFISAHATELANRAVEVIGEYDPSAVSELDIDISGYEAVKIVGDLSPATDNTTLWLRLSNDGGSTFRSGASDYWWHRNWAVAASEGGDGDDADSEIHIGGGVGNAAGEHIGFEITVIVPAESGRKTVVTSMCTLTQADASGALVSASGSNLTAEVNDYVRLLFSSGNIASGHVIAYGYRSGDSVLNGPDGFQGALVDDASSQSINDDTSTLVNFDSEDYDYGGWHDTSTNNERLTVPAGVTRVRVSAGVTWAANATGFRRIVILKNAATAHGIGHLNHPATTDSGWTTHQSVSSAVIEVTATDYFTVSVRQKSGGALNITDQWFAIEKVT